ncbi:MAG: helix-turn-helix domain-containing protein [Bacteroidales bacterium]
MLIRTQYELTDFLVKKANLSIYHPAALTLIVLSGWSGEDWRCWPSYESIAARSGVSVRSTKTHIKLLIELGAISMTKGRSNGAAYDHNIYTFQIQRLLEGQV